MARIRISDETLNCYGTWIRTEGVDLTQYQKNPVMLWMHCRGVIIGTIKDIRVENGEITGEPVFDEVREESKLAKQQWEKGSLRMGSPNFEVIEVSDDPALLKQGQRRPTITKCKLVEYSMVDIGGNDNNIRLTYANKELKLAKGEDCEVLPLLKESIINPNNKSKMNQELQAIALMLGLSAEATLTDVQKQVRTLLELKKENETLGNEVKTLKEQLDGIQLSGITSMVDEAIKAGKFTADKKNHFVELGKKVGAESLKLTLDAMSVSMKPSTILNKPSAGGAPKQYQKLSEVPEAELKLMREEDKEQYKRLYKAEYGFECNI
jgi:hypothetical protein